MSRPNTRSKDKNHKSEDNEGNFSILRKFHLSKEISQDDIRQLYQISKPVCHTCRINSKDSPNCFCGLIPSSGSTRKSGLWQKISDIVQVFGPDPSKDLRAAGFPAGLTNLGATCYANSILQCLYMNSSFREGLFSVEPDLLMRQPVLDQLVRLFAQLQSSKTAVIDSAAFIKTLELDNASQQDSHEFLTLFLSLLEQSLSHSAVPKARSVVQNLFRGSISHMTRCSMCGKESKASSKLEDFYELELNVKGFKNLDESLHDYLSVEEMKDENQYFCELCGAHVDAARSIKLHKLPPVLNFHLKRYVFLPKTTTRKKLSSVFSFPQMLSMTKRLSNSSEGEMVYDLSAILIHKGAAVSSGHYVAHIKDDLTGQWWEFDDEHVTKLGVHPFGEKMLNCNDKKVDENTGSGCCEGSLVCGSNGTSVFSSVEGLNSTDHGGVFSSADAYMLMYNVKSKSAENKDMDSSCKVFPLHLSKEIEESNTLLTAACEEYRQKKDKELEFIAQRRQEVKLLLSEAAVQDCEKPFFWVSTEWLRQWSDNINPSAIDNTLIQCSHGKVPVSKVGLMKRVSEMCWQKLISKYGGGPELSGNDYCSDCLEVAAKTMVFADSYKSERPYMRELAEAAISGNCRDEGQQYYVSRSWLLQWLRRKNVDALSDADAGPTASLQCPHGELLPVQATGAKRVQVPESLWVFLVESAKAVRPDDVSGCLSFPISLEPCAVCLTDLAERTCLEDGVRAVKMNLRRNHERLFSGKCFVLDPNVTYYLLPSSWLSRWKAYVNTSGKNFVSSDQPENLNAAMDYMKCERHGKLMLRPPELTRRRGLIIQRPSLDGGTLVTDADWKFFCEEWNVPQSKCISAEIDCPSCGRYQFHNSSVDVAHLETDLSSEDLDSSDVPMSPVVRMLPEICETCLEEKEQGQLMQRRNYFDEDIYVYFVHGKEPPKSLLEARSRVPVEAERRASKRSRRTAGCHSVSMRVSGSTSVYQLKMMIWESFGVVKENQNLHKGVQMIYDESATLASLDIFSGDVLWFTDSELHDNRDIADELVEQKMEDLVERGFQGTMLSANIALQQE